MNHLSWIPVSKTKDCAGDSISELARSPWNSWLDATEEGADDADTLFSDALLLWSWSVLLVVCTVARKKALLSWWLSLSLELSRCLAELTLRSRKDGKKWGDFIDVSCFPNCSTINETCSVWWRWRWRWRESLCSLSMWRSSCKVCCCSRLDTCSQSRFLCSNL